MEQIDIKTSTISRRGVKLARLLEKEEEDGENAIFGTYMNTLYCTVAHRTSSVRGTTSMATRWPLKVSEWNHLGNHTHAEIAHHGRFNDSVACITKQRGCSSEGKPMCLSYARLLSSSLRDLTIDQKIGQTGHTGWHLEDTIAKLFLKLKSIAHTWTTSGVFSNSAHLRTTVLHKS